ncbi:MAG: hypothetical protein ACXVJT_17785, partial [Thermoanaerobaculia bacterium]
MRAFAFHRGESDGDLAGTILCHDVPSVFRKGHVLGAADIPLLRHAEWDELHLLELGADDVAQREAGEQLARMLSSASLEVAPAGHRHVLKAKHDGLVKVDAHALARINSVPGIAVFTLPDDQVVSKDQVVVEAQITPLAIERSALERVRGEGSVVRILSFARRDVVLFELARRRPRAAATVLSEKLRSFNCEVRDVIEVPNDAESIRSAMERRNETLFIVSGSNALDPLDPVFTALEKLGATMQRIGLPVHPGTLLWLATLRNATIIGLPTCGLGSQMTAFDLVLPKLLAEGRITNEELAALGHGGILQR